MPIRFTAEDVFEELAAFPTEGQKLGACVMLLVEARREYVANRDALGKQIEYALQQQDLNRRRPPGPALVVPPEVNEPLVTEAELMEQARAAAANVPQL